MIQKPIKIHDFISKNDLDFKKTDDDRKHKNFVFSKIPVKENEIINPKKVATAKELILKKYRDEGFFMAYVKVDISEVDEETNTVIVKFIIDEGEDIPVSKINIFGNKEIDTYEILNVLELKESGFLESGTFKESSFDIVEIGII